MDSPAFVKGPAFFTIPNAPRISYITYEAQFSSICSVGLAPFGGMVEIHYSPDKLLLEFESFETWLRQIANDHHSIESFARMVLDRFVEIVKPLALRVAVHATTQVHGPVTATVLWDKFLDE